MNNGAPTVFIMECYDTLVGVGVGPEVDGGNVVITPDPFTHREPQRSCTEALDVVSVIAGRCGIGGGSEGGDGDDGRGSRDLSREDPLALKQLPREKVQVATKFGVAGFDASGVIVKGTPEYARSCCEASLKSLDVDYIDLYYIHRIDSTVPIEYTMGELKKLVNEGKIKYIGLSEASPDTIRRAHAVHPITAIEMDYSLWIRDIEDEIIPLCRELGIGIVPYSPLGRGFFAGKAVVESADPNSSLTDHPRLKGENFDKNKAIYFRMEALAKKHGCTPAQLAIAWVLHQGDDVVPIPGTTKIKNLHSNIDSLKMKLTKDDLKEITDAVPINEVAGSKSSNEAFHKITWEFVKTPLPK
ncbi:unnamed protein product [Fraxinus pennsylvanica]|uniref:NADP-dependent oxidoreductase domain-containing protein n=1 Tax=Fraxinus pennsylvanica TaxID=56036 RepID=A0AAD2DUF9_9LAMI|nr:unnamed protein product [Fraxinus pennsylvanica]